MKIALVVQLFLLLAACSPHVRSEVSPILPLPESFSQDSDSAGEIGGETADWWEIFGDEKLNTLMESAFAGNLDLRQAAARLEQAEALLGVAGSARYPVLSLDASGGKARQPSTAGPVTAETYRLSASAVFELDLWKRVRALTDAARFDLEAARDDVETLCLTLSAEVADLYYLAAEQRAQIALSDRMIASAVDTVDLVERRYRQGLVPAIDLYQARQNLAASRSRRPVFEASLASAEHALSLLTGGYPESGIVGETQEIPRPVNLSSLPLPSKLLERRPDIRAAMARLQGIDERIAAAVADRFPSFSLVGSYGGASDDLSSLLNSGNLFWSLLLNLSQPLLDGGRRSAEVDRQRAVFREGLARYHKTILLSFREVEDALAQGRADTERLSALTLKVDAARENLRLSIDRYRQGLTDYLPVLTAQGLAFDAESQHLAARRQLISDRISLARALGGEWMGKRLDQQTAAETAEE